MNDEEYRRPTLPHDEPEPPPAAWAIRLAGPLGDDEPLHAEDGDE